MKQFQLILRLYALDIFLVITVIVSPEHFHLKLQLRVTQHVFATF